MGLQPSQVSKPLTLLAPGFHLPNFAKLQPKDKAAGTKGNEARISPGMLHK